MPSKSLTQHLGNPICSSWCAIRCNGRSHSSLIHLLVDLPNREEAHTYESNLSWSLHDQLLYWIKDSRIAATATRWRSIAVYCNLFLALRVANETLGIPYIHTLRTEWMADGVLLPNTLERIASLFGLPFSPKWDRSLVNTVINSRDCRGQNGNRK